VGGYPPCHWRRPVLPAAERLTAIPQSELRGRVPPSNLLTCDCLCAARSPGPILCRDLRGLGIVSDRLQPTGCLGVLLLFE
jgi:hypothetical protein